MTVLPGSPHGSWVRRLRAAATIVMFGAVVAGAPAAADAASAPDLAAHASTGQAASQWQRVQNPAALFSSGNFIAQHSYMCLDLPEGNPNNGVRLVQWTCNGKSNQIFGVEDLGDGYFRLRTNTSGSCAQVAGNSMDDGGFIQQYRCLGGGALNEVWYSENLGDSYRLVNAKSGKCMNVAGVSHANGAAIIQYRCGTGGGNERWAFGVPT